MHYILQSLGFVLQAIGVLIIFCSNVRFWFKYRELGLKKAFLSYSFPRVAPNKDYLMNLSERETEELMDSFPLAKLLYKNYVVSVKGAIITLIGIIIAFFGSFIC